MSDIYTTITPILAGISILASAAVGYLLYREREIAALVKEVVDLVVVAKNANQDDNISNEEYDNIMKHLNDVAVKLKAVIYKKQVLILPENVDIYQLPWRVAKVEENLEKECIERKENDKVIFEKFDNINRMIIYQLGAAILTLIVVLAMFIVK